MKKPSLLILLGCLTLLTTQSPAIAWQQTDIEFALEANHAYDAGDYAKAALLYDQLAKQGNAVAQFHLGNMYELGQHLPKNTKESIQWYLLAAEQGYAPAQFNLGLVYAKGEGVQQDLDRAFGFYRTAAEQGYAPAQVTLGSMYANGEHVFQDHQLAIYWYRLAATQGNAAAQSYLGDAYDAGLGVPQEPTLAYMWLKLAVANAKTSVTQAQYAERLASLTRKLNDGQIALAHKLGVNCAASAYQDCSNQYSPTGQHVALQHEQQSEHQQEQPRETQQLPAEPEISNITSEDVHPATQHQQQNKQETKQSQDQHVASVSKSGSL